MLFRADSRSTVGIAIQLLAFSLIGPLALAASAPTESSREDKSTPQLTVRVYGAARLSRGLLDASEAQAARMLRDLSFRFSWVNCTSPSLPGACMSDLAPTDLVVRVLNKALPQATQDALGIACCKPRETTAFLFYDRMVAVRTQTRSLSSIMGRVLAHEIVHLLLPWEKHSDAGLMRGQWSTDDLRTDSSACIGLSVGSVRLLESEALRRVVGARSLRLK